MLYKKVAESNVKSSIANHNIDLYRKENNLEMYLGDYHLQLAEKEIFNEYFSEPLNILDLGCGGGRVTLALHEDGHTVTGVDPNQEITERAKKRFPYLTFQSGDARSLNFPADTFDGVVFSYNGLDYLSSTEERNQALKEIHRVLKKDGLFVFSLHNLDHLSLGPLGGVPIKVWSSYLTNYRDKECAQINESTYGGFITFYTRPRSVKTLLEENGFHYLSSYGNRPNSRKGKLLRDLTGNPHLNEPWVYYVARASTLPRQ